MKSARRLSLTLEALPRSATRANAALIAINYGFCETPVGRCLLGEYDGCVCYLAFAPSGSDSAMLSDLAARWSGASLSKDSEKATQTINSIFFPSKEVCNGIKLLVQGTEFQIQVWEALLKIPYASLSTYVQVAEAVGRPKASRAVGTAIGANPIAWLIPCHRVVRSDGGPGGYRWGLAAKKACLNYEKNGPSASSHKLFIP